MCSATFRVIGHAGLTVHLTWHCGVWYHAELEEVAAVGSNVLTDAECVHARWRAFESLSRTALKVINKRVVSQVEIGL